MTDNSENDRESPRDHLLAWVGELFARLFFWRASGVWGFVVLTILLLVGRHEITPGREWFHLGWPTETYYGILALVGAIVGILGSQRRLLGSLAGAIAAVGSLAAVSLLLRYVPQPPVEQVWIWVNVISMMVGFLPGVGLYAVVDNLLARSAAKAAAVQEDVAAAKAQDRLERRRRERGLSAPE